jgi:hypothetical protein
MGPAMSFQRADERHGVGRLVLFGVATVVLLFFVLSYVR